MQVSPWVVVHKYGSRAKKKLKGRLEVLCSGTSQFILIKYAYGLHGNQLKFERTTRVP
jgi:hypothetical protein